MTALLEKSFDISKQQVWDAFRQVRRNKGAPGVDGVSLAEFEEGLGDNLYKIWNRLCSGSYSPPPVKAVEIPKPGGVRVLAVDVPRPRGTKSTRQGDAAGRRWNAHLRGQWTRGLLGTRSGRQIVFQMSISAANTLLSEPPRVRCIPSCLGRWRYASKYDPETRAGRFVWFGSCR